MCGVKTLKVKNMENQEKVNLAMVVLLTFLGVSYANITYSTGLADTLKDILPWITVAMIVILGIALLLIALDFIVAGVVPDKVIELVAWIGVLFVSVMIVIATILNQLKI